jgi:hypothetical protein
MAPFSGISAAPSTPASTARPPHRRQERHARDVAKLVKDLYPVVRYLRQFRLCLQLEDGVSARGPISSISPGTLRSNAVGVHEFPTGAANRTR